MFFNFHLGYLSVPSSLTGQEGTVFRSFFSGDIPPLVKLTEDSLKVFLGGGDRHQVEGFV